MGTYENSHSQISFALHDNIFSHEFDGLYGEQVSFSTLGSVQNGSLSKWSCKVSAPQAKELFNIIWDNAEQKFTHSADLATENKMRRIEATVDSRNAANLVFAKVADKRSMLGMAGNTAPDNLVDRADSLPLVGCALAPLAHAATLVHHDHIEVRRLPPAAPPPRLQYDYLGPDPQDPSSFYFAQCGRLDASGDGPQQFRLSCARSRVWRSSAPRSYGPGPEWGGAWGGGLSPYTNAALSNMPVRGRYAAARAHA